MSIKLVDLIGESLSGLLLEEMIQVYRVDQTGMKTESYGFFRSELLAEVVAQTKEDTRGIRVRKVFVLSDGNEVYPIGNREGIVDQDQEAFAADLKSKALAKLAIAERLLLGLSQ